VATAPRAKFRGKLGGLRRETAAVNCPRCHHGAIRIDDGFLCTGCRAAFVEVYRRVEPQPLVASQGDAFSVIERIGPNIRSCAMLVILTAFAVVAWLNQTPQTAWLFWTVSALTVAVALAMFRERFARVVVRVAGGTLCVRREPGFAGWSRRVSTSSIAGFWVRAVVDEEGIPYGAFRLMIDQRAHRARPLLSLTRLEPAIFLAESLAALLALRHDTRGAEAPSVKRAATRRLSR
jgi:hypothetical protein